MSAVPYTEALGGLTAGTTYFACALASNSQGTAFGTIVSFTTPAAPAMTTSAASSVTGSSALLGGTGDPNGAATTGYFRISATNPGACDDSFGTRVPSTSGSPLGSGTAAVSYSQTASGLTSSTTYFFCAIGQNSEGTSFGSIQSFTTPAAPVVTTGAASAITGTFATLNGAANPNGAATTAWFRYSTVDPGACTDTFGTRTPSSGGTPLGSGTSSVSFAAGTFTLTAGTTYYFCAIAQNAAGIATGTVQSFSTPGAPTTTTAAATVVTSSSAQLNGTAIPRGATTTGYFRWSTSASSVCTLGVRLPSSGGTDVGAGSSAQPFSQVLTGLAPNTTYYFCAIATNAAGTTTGTTLSFTTPTGPTVTTTAATQVTGTGATINGSANPLGAQTTGWFRYATVSPGSCNDTFGTRAPSTGGTDVGTGTSAVTYSQALTGLTPGTTYYFCALGQNTNGLSTGALLSFFTPSPPTATTGSVTSVTTSSATLNGSAVPNGASTTGYFRFATTNPGTCDDTFGTRAPGAGGSALGAGSTATSYSQAITGLQPSTTYFFCAIATSPEGTRTGTVQSFTTPAAPAVTTNAATSITASSATLNASGTPNGAATTGWFRWAPNDPGTCNDTFGTRAPASGGATLGSGTSPQSFSQTATGLQPGTTYFFCAMVTNTFGTSFGAVQSFTTPAALPIVTTTTPSMITGTSALLGGTVNPGGASATAWVRVGVTNPLACNDSFGARLPATGGTTIPAGTTAVAFSEGAMGLVPGATYYTCAVAQNSAGTAFGSLQSFTLPNRPTTTTVAASQVTNVGAVINGSVTANGAPTTAYFRYATTNPGTCNDTFGTRSPASGGFNVGSGGSPLAVAQSLTGLQQATQYYYCAIATNVVGTSFGQVLSFTTHAAPGVTTSSATNVSSSMPTLNGSARANGVPTTAWFRYHTADPGTCNDTFGTRAPFTGSSNIGSGAVDVPFSQAIVGLAPGVTIFFCAIAQNQYGLRFGQVLSFTAFSPPPTVVTDDATDVQLRAATLRGTATPNGTETTGWFRYSLERPAACDDLFGTRVPAMGGLPVGAAGPMSFSLALMDLKPNRTYHSCAVASNMGGAAFGSLKSFTTPPTQPTARTQGAEVGADGAVTFTGAANPNGSEGKAWFRYDTERPLVCILGFGTTVPAEGLTLGNGHEEVQLTQVASGLKPGTYFYCLYSSTPDGNASGDVLQFEIADPGKTGTIGCSCGQGGAGFGLAIAALLARWRRRGRRA